MAIAISASSGEIRNITVSTPTMATTSRAAVFIAMMALLMASFIARMFNMNLTMLMSVAHRVTGAALYFGGVAAAVLRHHAGGVSYEAGAGPQAITDRLAQLERGGSTTDGAGDRDRAGLVDFAELLLRAHDIGAGDQVAVRPIGPPRPTVV